jgi:hypothetical protein
VRPPIVLGTTLALAALSAAARADLGAFFPRPTRNGAFVDVEASREQDDFGVGDRHSGWTDDFTRERLTVFSYGYVYDPRFLQYSLSLGWVPRQERYQVLGAPAAPRAFRSGFEYDVRLLMLAEHPYFGEVFARRFAPQFKERAATGHDTVGTSRGASLHYRRKPYFFEAGAQDTALQSATSRSDVTSYRLSGQFFKEYRRGRRFSLSASADPTRFTGTSVDGRTRQYYAEGVLTLPPVTLSSTAVKNSVEQQGEGGPVFRSDQRSLLEHLSANLPKGFTTRFSWSDHRSEGSVSTSESAPPASNSGQSIEAELAHRLYRSLDSRYAFHRTSDTSSRGESTLVSHGLSGLYRKFIPHGRLQIGANGGWTNTDSQGQGDVFDEPHLAQSVPGEFTLAQPDVAPESIRLFLKSPVAPFENVPLTENVDYVALPVMNTIEIRVIGLPVRFVVPGVYDFFVFYSLTRASFGLHEQTFGANVSAELFQDRLSPYASYSKVRSQVVSGSLPGPPPDTTSRSVGLGVRKGELQGRIHYDAVDWEFSPSRLWAVEAQYFFSVGRATRITATASYQNRYFPHGSSPASQQPIRDELAQGSGSVRHQLFSRHLILAGGGSFSRSFGWTHGQAYGLNGSLNWRLGKLTLEAGGAASWADSQAQRLAPLSRTHQFYYVSLHRDLF